MGSDDWASANDDWGSSKDNSEPAKKEPNDDWGSAKKEQGGGSGAPKDDWGSSSNDGWGSSAKSDQGGAPKNNGWGGPPRNDRGPPRNDWGGPPRNDRGPPRNNRGPPRNDRGPRNDWGGPPRDGNRGQNNNNNNSDSWGSAKKDHDGGAPKDDWGASSNNDGWGSSSADKGASKDDWGSSGADKGAAKDDWGSSSADKGAAKDDWGSSNNTSERKFSRQADDNNSPDMDSSRKRFKQEGEDGAPPPPPYKPEELDLEEEARLQSEGAGENFQRYNDQKVTCIPKDIITPVEKFDDVVASKLLLKNIESQHYTGMTPIQKWAMPAIMEGHDLIGCAQTGSGKTAAFLLPVLQTLLNSDLEPNDPNSDCQNPYCLIISPTRELANQIYVHANMLSKDSIIKCHVIYGQVSTAHLKSKLSTGCHMLVATVGRLKDFVQRGWIGFKNIKYIILDEGDRLVDDGFSSDVRNFFNHESMPPRDKRQTLFFSATFKEETQLNAREYLKDNFVFLTVGKVGAANVDIRQEFLQVSRQEKKRELKKILSEVPENEKTIVFTQTKTAADMLAGFFTALNLSSTSIHGDRHQSQREQAIRAFKKGEKRFLISSPVGNRGLDLPKVSLVINYDLPPCIDEYVHRIGRTGRAGHTGRALSFYDEERDRDLLPSLVQIMTEAKQEIPDWMTGSSNTAATSDGADDWGCGSSDKPATGDDWGSSAKTNDTPGPSAAPPAAAPAAAADDGWGAGSDGW